MQTQRVKKKKKTEREKSKMNITKKTHKFL